MQKKSMVLISAALLIIAIMLSVFKDHYNAKSSKLLEQLYDYSGYTRVISEEELNFYQYFVERDLPAEISRQELEEKTKLYAEKINAIFFIGNKLHLCEPYSFELLKFRMQQENETRKIEKEQGEIIYGLEQFTLETYFQYVFGNLETALHQYLEQNADEGILELAKEYYRKNKNLFKYREKVVYEVSFEGNIELVSADGTQLNTLGKSDIGLADFLYCAEINDKYEDIQDGGTRTVVIKDIIYSEDSFEKNQDIILYKFIREELYEKVIEQITINNPINFEEN